ncbi:membrane protein insertase YidC [Bacillus toyonensis]|uniref:membrane protein insertase YidC n=1 Tax=Bacillus toyonensis TaxID=155322 RepID=UPI000279647C|nr:membrane protein insertase YidC [Bacillus toyonensis]EJQ72238.1 YidC/Oxa1 family membrane protein insertase [Bacillus toyonensis]QWG98546.1 membrane protein insertase YidC [Bacillus toyonensis]HDR7226161.1 membrane protein insertase YidC [Bacillus toyonensis]HDR7839235.1 membrane protein insertase YidC [Bacillus toyonensis]
MMDFVVDKFSNVLVMTSDILNVSYMVALIVLIIGIKILLIPISVFPYINQVKKRSLSIEIANIKQEFKEANQKKEFNLAVRELYRKNNIKNFKLGCLPLLIQMPILLCLYQSIILNQFIQNETFLWVKLGDIDPFYVFPLCAALVTGLQMYITQDRNQDQNKWMFLMMPSIIFVVSKKLPSIVAIYWTISGIFLIFLTIIVYSLYSKKYIIKRKN